MRLGLSRRHNRRRLYERDTLLAYLVAVAITYVVSGFSRTVWAQTSPPKQAVVETTAGTFIIDLSPAAAPNQAAYFMKTAAEGGYDGTIFHRMVPRRNGSGRRSAVEGSFQTRRLRYRRPQCGERRSACAEDDQGIDSGGDGAWEGRQRRRAVLHRARRPADTRRQIHSVRSGIGRDGGAA